MLKYELATSLTLNEEKMLPLFEWTSQTLVSQRWLFTYSQVRVEWEFRYIYKQGNPSRSRGRAYLFHVFLTTTRNDNEIQRSILLIMIICEILLFIFYLF